MPAHASGNNLHYLPSSPIISRSNSASPSLSSSPLSSSPSNMCPMTNFKRSTSDISNSSRCSSWSQVSSSYTSPTPTVMKDQCNREIFHHDRHQSSSSSSIATSEKLKNTIESTNTTFTTTTTTTPNSSVIHRGILGRIIAWYFNLLIKIICILSDALIFVTRAPALWASAWFCIWLVILQLPLTLLKCFITMLYTPASELARNKRCVLISGGSTVQAVHLARNFYKAGARVIVCEVDGLFGLARFSTACSKFYTIPQPHPGNAAEYVKALKNIVEKEKAVYYIPVSSTNAAYYDALAKPHLEIMGCECFIPCATEVTALDDPIELLRRCRSIGLTTPVHFILRSVDDVLALYNTGALRSGRHVMLAAGPAGMRDRRKVSLPPSAQEFQNIHRVVNDNRPWVVIRDPGGPHFITCTTVKNSRVVANVTCRVDESKGLIPEARNDVAQWLDHFITESFSSTRINGHLSFRLVVSASDELVALGCRVGVGLPYICLTSVHPRLVWRPCRHFSRKNSGPLHIGANDDGNLHKGFPSALKQASNKSTGCFGNVLDKREALFVYWDPLPYCAYYHLQLPFIRIAGALRAQPGQHNPPLAVVK
ncbi:hypothetical protein PV325_012343 [Microctonus aethiopoides]|nr:hypothetical protein PV325_012343 [Microctonus aethiopoides]